MFFFLTLLISASAPFEMVAYHTATSFVCLSLQAVSIQHDPMNFKLFYYRIAILVEKAVFQKCCLIFRRNSLLNTRTLVEEYFHQLQFLPPEYSLLLEVQNFRQLQKRLYCCGNCCGNLQALYSKLNKKNQTTSIAFTRAISKALHKLNLMQREEISILLEPWYFRKRLLLVKLFRSAQKHVNPQGEM